MKRVFFFPPRPGHWVSFKGGQPWSILGRSSAPLSLKFIKPRNPKQAGEERRTGSSSRGRRGGGGTQAFIPMSPSPRPLVFPSGLRKPKTMGEVPRRALSQRRDKFSGTGTSRPKVSIIRPICRNKPVLKSINQKRLTTKHHRTLNSLKKKLQFEFTSN